MNKNILKVKFIFFLDPSSSMRLPVTLVLLTLISGWVSGDQPVLLELYYESMCPDCQEFIADQLYNTWTSLHKTGLY